MRKVWPFIGLAVAVAAGVAAAPLIPWVVAIAAAGGGAVLLWRWRLGVFVAVLMLWPAVLAQRGQWSDALFICALYAVIMGVGWWREVHVAS